MIKTDISPSDIKSIITISCNKTSPLDPFPHQVLINCIDTLSIAIANLTNLSLKEGRFPTPYKTAQILPLLKKPNLDCSLPANFRPISNLPTISKIMERALLRQLLPHITSNPNFTSHQSAYRPNHSTETALLHVLDEVYNGCNDKKVSILTSLDLSAAFDTIDHKILINRLQYEFGIEGSALNWIESYLSNRKQFVKLGTYTSPTVSIEHGVPQGSVLGPLLFTTYISPVGDIISSSNMIYHQYADDTQLLQTITPSDPTRNINALTDCVQRVECWFLLNGLQLNTSKTEVIKLGTSQQLKLCSNVIDINLGSTSIPISSTLKVLGITLDSRLSFRNHITLVIQSCNYHLRAISHIRSFITNDMAATLIRCLVISRLDYCNSMLYNIAQCEQSRLQRIMNKAARVALNINTRDHYLLHSSVTYLALLHWLPLKLRIFFKVALITFKSRSSSTPSYLNNLIINKPQTRTLRSSNAPLLRQQSSTNNISKRAFRHASPAVWNSLPPNIRNCLTISSFKANLKTHLFQLAYNSNNNNN